MLHGLNDKQYEAVTAPLGNMLVLAGAGSGKTRVLVSRIAWLIAEMELSPQSILAVTFTNKAAGEMKARLQELLDIPMMGFWVGTFHGLCHRLLRRHFKEANLPEQFHILDSDDQLRMVKRVIASLNLDPDQWPPKKAQAYINNKKDEGIRAKHIQTLSYGPEKTLQRIYLAYEQACQIAGVVDFAELMLRAHELLRDNPTILAHYRQRFQAILVDEFQDTNTIQYAWIRLIAGDEMAVMAVGDDDQSIYGWRGAKVENIEQFVRDFSHVDTIRLEQNYRSTATILQAANHLISNNQGRMGKNLWTEGSDGEKIMLFSAFNEIEEARFVAEKIQQILDKGTRPDEIAVLYRSNALSRVMEESLIRAGISYRIYGGMRFFERAEIKDALAYLRLMLNEHDDTAFERVVNLPTRGIGEKTVDSLRVEARENDMSLWQAAEIHLDENRLPTRAANALAGFLTLIKQMRHDLSSDTLETQVQTVIQLSGLETLYENMKGDKGEAKLENLKELVSAARQFRFEEGGDVDETLTILGGFLAHASLESGEMQADAHELSVHLMTLHAAKGLEFPYVFIIGLEEGVFPSQQSHEEAGRLEEERRLCYVGMTRAMEQLILTYAEIRRQYGREEYHRPSRFLHELPSALIDSLRSQKAFTPTTSGNSFSSAMHPDCGFRLGETVYHAKFGAGTILAFEGSGAHQRVQVNFDLHGTKWLVLSYANLSKQEDVPF
jgi:DNA helicase-2/ATP-dependent DNA helicase PcrA